MVNHKLKIMKNIIEILNTSFAIEKIAVHNFTILNKDIYIEIEIMLENCKKAVIVFENVRGINVISESYSVSSKSSIVIEDISAMQMEGVNYKIAISEDAMLFFCKKIDMR